MMKKFYEVTLLERNELSKDTYSFTFSTEGIDFDFLPGQYITLCLEIDEKDEMRDFSIASSPLHKQNIMIVTKKGVSDFKKKLFELERGDIVKMSLPCGGFVFDTNGLVPQVFIAGGIGITPFYSMLQYMAKEKVDIPVTLFVSFSRVEDVILYEELTQIEKVLSHVKVIYTVSSPITGWHGERGRIHQELLRKYIPDIFDPNYSIVGKPEMVDDMYDLLRNMDVVNEKIKIEYFSGY